MLATFIDVAGVPYPDSLDGRAIKPLAGRSLMPAFADRPIVHAEGLYWEHEGHRAVRLGRWKLVAKHGDPWALYDMEVNRTELNDLAGPHPEKVEELNAAYAGWADRSGVLPWLEFERIRAEKRRRNR